MWIVTQSATLWYQEALCLFLLIENLRNFQTKYKKMARRLPRYGVDCLILSPFVLSVSQDRQLAKRGINSSPRFLHVLT